MWASSIVKQKMDISKAVSRFNIHSNPAFRDICDAISNTDRKNLSVCGYLILAIHESDYNFGRNEYAKLLYDLYRNRDYAAIPDFFQQNSLSITLDVKNLCRNTSKTSTFNAGLATSGVVAAFCGIDRTSIFAKIVFKELRKDGLL